MARKRFAAWCVKRAHVTAGVSASFRRNVGSFRRIDGCFRRNSGMQKDSQTSINHIQMGFGVKIITRVLVTTLAQDQQAVLSVPAAV